MGFNSWYDIYIYIVQTLHVRTVYIYIYLFMQIHIYM